jgi:hypothetical protein
VNEFHPNLKKTTSTVLSVILFNLCIWPIELTSYFTRGILSKWFIYGRIYLNLCEIKKIGKIRKKESTGLPSKNDYLTTTAKQSLALNTDL